MLTGQDWLRMPKVWFYPSQFEMSDISSRNIKQAITQSLESNREVQAGHINLEIVSTQMVFKVINLDEVTKGGKRSKELKAGDPTLRGTNRGYGEGSSREVGEQPGQRVSQKPRETSLERRREQPACRAAQSLPAWRGEERGYLGKYFLV